MPPQARAGYPQLEIPKEMRVWIEKLFLPSSRMDLLLFLLQVVMGAGAGLTVA